MTICFVLMNTQAGFVEPVVRGLEKIPEVKESYPVTGGIDIIVKVEGQDVETIAKTILAKIHSIEGVTRTETHIVVPL
ncbi:MAG: Lrp/AsnC family transcriptional regulator [Promethearchaeota archaeon]